MNYPNSIKNMIVWLSRLPSVGPKTAERFVFYLLQQSDEDLQKFAQALAELKEKTTVCKSCLEITETSPCAICQNKNRDQNKICVVINTRNMLAIESTGNYSGLYHILGGLIDTINDVKPDSLNISQLKTKVNNKKITEIILALSPTIEGETTAMHISKLFKDKNIIITRLAQGLPTGSDLDYADNQTLSNALKFRNKI